MHTGEQATRQPARVSAAGWLGLAFVTDRGPEILGFRLDRLFHR